VHLGTYHCVFSSSGRKTFQCKQNTHTTTKQQESMSNYVVNLEKQWTCFTDCFFCKQVVSVCHFNGGRYVTHDVIWTFVESEGLLPCSLELTTAPCPMPVKSIPHPTSLRSISHLSLGLLCSLFPSGSLIKIVYEFLVSLFPATCLSLQKNYVGHCPLSEVYLIYTTFWELALLLYVYFRQWKMSNIVFLY
jgi:hypothetical protein